MQRPSELELLAWLIDTLTPEQVYKAFCVALSFKSRSFSLWQGRLFFAHTSLSFTFTRGVAYNYCPVNSFFCNIHDVQRQQSSKRSRGREVCSLLRITNSHQGEKIKGKKKEYLTKREITKYQWPSVPPSSVTHAIWGIVQVIPQCLWLHISAALFRSTVLFVKSFTIRVTASNSTIWLLRVTNILHNIKAIILSTESNSAVSIHWEFTELESVRSNLENASILLWGKCVS